MRSLGGLPTGTSVSGTMFGFAAVLSYAARKHVMAAVFSICPLTIQRMGSGAGFRGSDSEVATPSCRIAAYYLCVVLFGGACTVETLQTKWRFLVAEALNNKLSPMTRWTCASFVLRCQLGSLNGEFGVVSFTMVASLGKPVVGERGLFKCGMIEPRYGFKACARGGCFSFKRFVAYVSGQALRFVSWRRHHRLTFARPIPPSSMQSSNHSYSAARPYFRLH